jgi:hypothetical protein
MTKRRTQRILTINLILVLTLSAIAIPDTAAASSDSPPYEETEVIFPDEDVPKCLMWFPPIRVKTWALLNLILSVSGVLLACVVAIHMLIMHDCCDKEEKDIDKDFKPDSFSKKSRIGWLTAMLATTFASVLLFILTQDMTEHMVLIDIWTIAHLKMLAVGITASTIVMKELMYYRQ